MPSCPHPYSSLKHFRHRLGDGQIEVGVECGICNDVLDAETEKPRRQKADGERVVEKEYS